ncbi:MAG: ornithine cyclodeaminase family protein [bacterium]|nr:ornithine cyclodeaminase family protein [bacterium]
MLCINENDILNAVKPVEVVDAVEAAVRLYETDEFKMPDRMHIDHDGNTLLLMPAIAGERFSTKLVSVFPGNARKNLPMVMGTVILNNGETGEPLALLNGSALTALRTGAVGAVAIRHLTPVSLKTAGIVGTGVQGFNQAFFAAHVRELSDIFIYGRDVEKARVLNRRLSQELAEQKPGIAIHTVTSIEELLGNSEAVITATTSPTPVLPDDSKLLSGRHYVGIGSFRPNMREFPEALFKLVDRVYVDTHHAKAECGDLVIPLENRWIEEHQVSTLGKRISAVETPLEGKTTLFKSVGMALFDLTVSDLIYQRALEKGLGTNIEV